MLVCMVMMLSVDICISGVPEFFTIPFSLQDRHALHPALRHQTFHSPRVWKGRFFFQGHRRFFPTEVFLQEEFQGPSPVGSAGGREGRAAVQGQHFVDFYGHPRVWQIAFRLQDIKNEWMTIFYHDSQSISRVVNIWLANKLPYYIVCSSNKSVNWISNH